MVMCAMATNLIHGYVRVENGDLLSHVDVQVEGEVVHTMTDSVGAYAVTTEKDSVCVIFSYVGYKTEKKYFYFTDKKKNIRRMDVFMREDTQYLSDVNVQGGRLQHTMSQRVDVSLLSVMPTAAGEGIEALVKNFQGVSSNNELSSQYSVRGGSYDENSVYVNGIEVYRPYLIRTGEQEGLSFVNPDLAGEVQFSAGGFDAKYGDKLSSVLDITYRKPRTFEAGIGGSFMGATAYVGSSNDKYSQIHGFRYKNASWLLGTLQTNAEYDPNFLDYQTYITYKPHDKVELSFLANLSQNTYNFKPITCSTTFGSLGDLQNFTVYFSGKEQDCFRTAFGALSVVYKPTDRWKLGLTLSAFYTDERISYDIEGEYWLNKVYSINDMAGEQTGVGNYYEHARNTMNSFVVKAALDGSVKLTEHNTLLWGVDFTQEMVNEMVQEWEMRDSSGYSIPYCETNPNLYYSLQSQNKLNDFRIKAYVQDQYTWHLRKGGIMSFNAGVRLNYWSFNNEATISPRLVIAYFPDIKPDIRFRFATGLYYQSPGYKEIKDTITVNGQLTNTLNREIKSQRSLQFIAGMDYYYNFLRHPFKLSVEVYYKHLSNLIPYNVDNMNITYLGKNNANGYAAGLDVKLFGEMVPGVDSWLGFSLMRTMEDIQGDGVGFIPRPTDQLYNISLFFQDYIPGLPQYRVHVLFNWAQGFPVCPPHSERAASMNLRAPDYRRVDIGISRVFEKGKDPWMGRGFFKPFRQILVAFEVLNLFGFNNVNSYYWVTDIYNVQYAVPNYLTGRQFNLKLQLKF